MRLFTDSQQAKRIWEVREVSLGATSHVPGEPLELGRLGRFRGRSRKTRRLSSRPAQDDGRTSATKARSTATSATPACTPASTSISQSKEGIAKFRKFMEEAADLVVSYGGSLSGEHGDGQARAELLPKMFGPELMQAFREFKSRMGPGLEDESRQARSETLQARRKSCASAPTTLPGSRRPTSSFPPITAAWRTPLCAASASANAVAKKAA